MSDTRSLSRRLSITDRRSGNTGGNTNSNKIILDLCGGTGAWSKPYKDAGYDVRLITLPDNDVLTYVPPDDIYGILAAPPCTMFSRARTTAKTERGFKGAMEIVYACLRIIWECQYKDTFSFKFWVMENPEGHLKRFLGKPAYRFHPYYFGDRHSKQTCLWGFFNDPIVNANMYLPLNHDEKLRSKNNTRVLPEIPKEYKCDGVMKPIQIRRSITPAGFAKAFFEVNQ